MSILRTNRKSKKLIRDKLLVGDSVGFKEGGYDKLQANWFDGYLIKEMVSPDAFIVSDESKEFRVNKCKVKKKNLK